MSTQEKLEMMVTYAQYFIKTPYVWGGNNFSGYDCCVVGDTLIQTDHSFKKIIDIKHGDFVKSYDNGQIVNSKVLGVYNNGVKKVLKLKTTKSMIKATENHKFLTLIQDGQTKITSTKVNTRELSFKELKDLSVGDIVLMASCQKVETKSIDLNNEQLRFLGAMLGDGWIIPNKGFSLPLYSEDHRDEFIKYFQSGYSCTYSPTRNMTSGLTFFSKKYLLEIEKWSVCNVKSKERTLPPWVFELNDEQLDNFIYGYFFTDGYEFYEDKDKQRKQYCIDSASKELIVQLHALLLSRGYKLSNVTVLKRNKDIYIKGKKIINASDSYRFYINEKKEFHIPSKVQRTKEYSCPYNQLNLSKEFNFQAITRIEDAGEAETYDLTIENSHNYFGDGYVIHNSGFVQEALASIGLDPKGDQSAQTLYDFFSTRWDERINRGSLLFFGKSKREITHTAIAVSKNFMIEAGGGGHLVLNEANAKAANAFIRIRPIDMRKDLIAGLFPREEL